MITIEQLPIFSDNVVYAVDVDGDAFVVDPGEADAVVAWLNRGPRRLKAILNTHHHPDHVGGNLALAAQTGCRIYGPAHDLERIPGATDAVAVNTSISVCGVTLRVLDVRAHTLGHIAYAMDDGADVVVQHGHGGIPTAMDDVASRPVLFVGDSLFAAGCGRLFEGNKAQLCAALRTLAAEDPRSLVCCAHEYTAANLRFAVAMFPDNAAIAARAAGLDDVMGTSRSSIPSTLSLELQTNPYLLALQDADPEERAFDTRQKKDIFPG